ncbi:hypothetical protein M758_4G167600, partial [Ceratodon purpureus]
APKSHHRAQKLHPSLLQTPPPTLPVHFPTHNPLTLQPPTHQQQQPNVTKFTSSPTLLPQDQSTHSINIRSISTNTNTSPARDLHPLQALPLPLPLLKHPNHTTLHSLHQNFTAPTSSEAETQSNVVP